MVIGQIYECVGSNVNDFVWPFLSLASWCWEVISVVIISAQNMLYGGCCVHTSPKVCLCQYQIRRCFSVVISVSNNSSFGPGGYYRSASQRPYPIKNRRYFKRTITLRPQILIREFSIWYVKYAALHGASFGRLRFSISLILNKRQPKNLVFTPKMTIISKQLAEF